MTYVSRGWRAGCPPAVSWNMPMKVRSAAPSRGGGTCKGDLDIRLCLWYACSTLGKWVQGEVPVSAFSTLAENIPKEGTRLVTIFIVILKKEECRAGEAGDQQPCLYPAPCETEVWQRRKRKKRRQNEAAP